MNPSEMINQLKGSSIEERTSIIEAILQTVKNDMRFTSSQQVISEHCS